RSYQYDFLSRMIEARSGVEADGGTGDSHNVPYRISYRYDNFGHQSDMFYKHFWLDTVETATSYTNNRISGKAYDADGDMTGDQQANKKYFFNAAGQLEHTGFPYSESFSQEEWLGYDGDGYLDKIGSTELADSYRIRSSVMNQAVVYEGGAFI